MCQGLPNITEDQHSTAHPVPTADHRVPLCVSTPLWLITLVEKDGHQLLDYFGTADKSAHFVEGSTHNDSWMVSLLSSLEFNLAGFNWIADIK